MSGLNDPFLLDDVMEDKDQLPVKAFKEMTPGEVPEISDHVTLIAAPIPDAETDGSDGIVEKTGEIASVAIEEYQVAMRDLVLLSDRIHAEGGMSLSIAQESLVVLPGFVNDDVRPMGYFTKHPSQTQLSEALEAIEETKKSAFSKVVDKVIAFINAVIERAKGALDKIKSLIKKETARETANTLRLLATKVGEEGGPTLRQINEAAHRFIPPALYEGLMDGSVTKALDNNAVAQDKLIEILRSDDAPEELPQIETINYGRSEEKPEKTDLNASEAQKLISRVAELAKRIEQGASDLTDKERAVANGIKDVEQKRADLKEAAAAGEAAPTSEDVILSAKQKTKAINDLINSIRAEAALSSITNGFKGALTKKTSDDKPAE